MCLARLVLHSHLEPYRDPVDNLFDCKFASSNLRINLRADPSHTHALIILLPWGVRHTLHLHVRHSVTPQNTFALSFTPSHFISLTHTHRLVPGHHFTGRPRRTRAQLTGA